MLTKQTNMLKNKYVIISLFFEFHYIISCVGDERTTDKAENNTPDIHHGKFFTCK